MKTCKQYRNQAWNALKNNWGSAAGTMLMLLILIVVCVLPSYLVGIFAPEKAIIVAVISIVFMFLLVMPLVFSFLNTLLDMVRTSTAPSLGRTFINLKNNWGKLIAYFILLYLIVIAVAALFVGIAFVISIALSSIDGMSVLSGLVLSLISVGSGVSVAIIQLMYSMTPYIIHDNPNISVKEAFRMSRIMMKGHKEDLLLLQITFLFWCLLGLVTFGIALLWVQPYMYTAQAAFYEEIREPQIEGAI